jgi:hypothetical protein
MTTKSNGSVGAGGVVSDGGVIHITHSNISHNKATMRGTAAIIAGGVVSEGGPVKISLDRRRQHRARDP